MAAPTAAPVRNQTAIVPLFSLAILTVLSLMSIYFL